MKKNILIIAFSLLGLTNSIFAADVITVDDFRITAGETKSVDITLNNDAEYVGFQFDLYLPDSISIESYNADRSRIPENTALSMSKQQDGSYRFITMAIDAEPITGNSGTIITLNVKAARGMSFGDDTGYFRNVKLSKSNATGPTYAEMPFPVKKIYYVIRYQVDGQPYQIDSVNYGMPIIPLTAPTKEGYTFSGWSEIPATMPANDVEVNGTFSINSYILTYKVDGAEYKKDTLNYADTVTPLTLPTKEGYTFSGWSEIPQTMPAMDVEVIGSFSINSYVITYKVDGEVYRKDTLNYAAAVTPLTVPTKEGYTFSGWSEIPQTMPAKDVEVNGTFSINSYVITYKVDGEVYRKDTLNYAAAVTPLAAPTKEGYTFSGWSEIPQSMPANDMEVIGTFVVNKYLLQVLIDGEEVYSDSIAFGTKLADYAALITEQGIDLSQWEFYDQIETVTMPAHDVIINAVRDGIMPVMIDKENTVIYDLTGKRVEADDINALPDGIYIINGRKYQIRR
ncbi:MAG: InlB B-repeat-containing protein [Bacteroidaceae bacterium]|nr:InlB B-repeat-containing protein [Bacteroidaceae bacterium]